MIATQPILAFLQSLGAPELIVIGIIALLIFGRRLPEVGRSLGKSFVEFKKGLKETSDDIKGSGEEIRKIQSEARNSGNDAPRSSEKSPSYSDNEAESVHS